MPMESEGPRKKFGAKRRLTAADQMSRQQKEHEERGGPARGEAPQAAAHNETHPKLKQQLDKRRSVAEFSDRPEKRMRHSQRDHDRGSTHYRRRQSRRKLDRPRRPRNNDRVAKRRERRPCTCSKCLKKPICRENVANLCVYVVNKRIGTDMLPLAETAMSALQPRGSIQGSNHSIGLRKPTSTNQSVSSYNSFDSMGHSPAV